MNEEIQFNLDVAEDSMKSAIHHLEEALVHIRAGKANPRILDAVRVDYYGSTVPIANVANITTPDARTIAIQPWEKKLIKDIEKAIINSEVGIMPDNNGEMIRLAIPPLTEERRKQLVKQARIEGEDARISVRNARHEAIATFKKLVKDGLPEDTGKDAEADAQKMHDKYMKRIDDVLAVKEKEILTV
ncbi:MAG: ribosome recycling factor [Bacteroidota bacterium]|nr:ribosome recycling factor [Bacteroidota bacterium]